MTDKLNELAFPNHYEDRTMPGVRNTVVADGMSLRVHAAIQLRVPDSGIPELDAMILEARRLDWAGMALTVVAIVPDFSEESSDALTAKRAYAIADALLAERDK